MSTIRPAFFSLFVAAAFLMSLFGCTSVRRTSQARPLPPDISELPGLGSELAAHHGAVLRSGPLSSQPASEPAGPKRPGLGPARSSAARCRSFAWKAVG